MIKNLKLTIIGVLISTLAIGQVVERKDVKYPNQGKAPKEQPVLMGANDMQPSFDKKKPKSNASKATIIFFEDFSSGSIPATFTLYDEDGNTPASAVDYVTDAWVANPNLLDSSDYTALSTSWYDPAGTADDWLVTPKITIPSGSKLSWNAIAYDSNFPDGYEVLISTTDSLVSSFSTVLFSTSAENSSWTSRTESLSAYAGQDVFIAFRNNSNDQFLLAVDDIEVYQPDPYEIGVTSVDEPNNDTGCTQTASEDVSITIENFGADSITDGFDVHYSINGAAPVTETITDTLYPGNTMNYTFNTKADLSAYQNYDIEAYTAYPQDNNNANDTAYTSVVSADSKLSVKIHTDNYPSEISWTLYDQANQVVSESPVYEATDSLYTTEVCLISSGCYTLEINDSYGDGIMSPGGYEVYMDNSLVDSSYSFSSDQAFVYNIGNGCAANDIAVEALYALGKSPEDAGSPQSISAIINNIGTDNQSNIDVYLNVTGDNMFQDTMTVSSLNSLASDTITFNSFDPANTGINNINITVADDDNNANNSADYYQEVTTDTYNHADTSEIDQGIGFNDSEGMMVARYHVNGKKSVSAARVNVSGSAAGNELYGVLMNANGDILSTGQPVSIMPADTNTYVELPIAPFNVEDEDIYIGFAQTLNPASGYFPLNTQVEDPARQDAFYYVGGLNGGNLTMSANIGRWMLEGVINNPVSDDAVITGITEINTACNLSSADVEIGIYNNGTDTIKSIDASYTVNGGSAVSETITSTINPGDTLMYTFPTAIDASSYQEYNVEAYISLTDDTIQSNDTTMTSFYNVEPEDIPYSTSFEMSDDNYAWTFIDGNDDGTIPQFLDAGTSSAHSGNMVVYVPGGSVKQDEYVVSRCLNLEAGKTYQMSYWHAAGSFIGTPIPEDVQIVMGTSPDPASLTTMVADLGSVDVTSFTKKAHDIQVDNDGVYYIAFHITTDSPYYYLLDDISISDVTSVEENISDQMSVFPNPTNNILNIEAGELTIENVQIYNTMGQLMHSKDVNTNNIQLDVETYESGMYFIQMLTDKGTVTKKFQVK
ncbi:MAG: choice-of-anchor J domain-containing protein [Bacteroidales bacterium]|nr:choice-of-anchor J domain-containing protein [Bacteroidales bacterium]